MPLLELSNVSKRFGRESHALVALQEASMELDSGELVAVWGSRRSGRSTLMRVAAGLETPDSGQVRFEGRELSDWRGEARVAYCRKTFQPTAGKTVADQLLVGQLSRGVAPELARARVHETLERVDAKACAGSQPSELDGAEVLRVAIARALTRMPRLLVLDEPTIGVDLLVRDEILLLLRSLANESIAVLMSTGETTCLAGADRALSLGKGKLHGLLAPELAPVLAFPAQPGRSASA